MCFVSISANAEWSGLKALVVLLIVAVAGVLIYCLYKPVVKRCKPRRGKNKNIIFNKCLFSKISVKVYRNMFFHHIHAREHLDFCLLPLTTRPSHTGNAVRDNNLLQEEQIPFNRRCATLRRQIHMKTVELIQQKVYP